VPKPRGPAWLGLAGPDGSRGAAGQRPRQHLPLLALHGRK